MKIKRAFRLIAFVLLIAVNGLMVSDAFAYNKGTDEVTLPSFREKNEPRVDDVIRRETFTLLAILTTLSLFPITIMIFVALKASSSHSSAAVKRKIPKRQYTSPSHREKYPRRSEPIVSASSDLYDVSQLSRYSGARDVRKHTRTWKYDKKLYGQEASPATGIKGNTAESEGPPKPRGHSRRWRYS